MDGSNCDGVGFFYYFYFIRLHCFEKFMEDNKLKAQILISIENDEDFERFVQAYQIDDFVNALKEILNNDPSVDDILEKHDILKFFT